MRIGDLVRVDAQRIGIVLEIRDNISVCDDECVEWKYPTFLRVQYLSGRVEINPESLYRRI